MKKISKDNRWIFWFPLVLAIVVIYKVLDNFTDIGEWIRKFL